MKKTILFNQLSAFDSNFYESRAEAALNVLKSGWWLNGTETKKFSSNFSNYLNIKHCLPLANGTDALEITMRTLYQKQASHCNEVITVANAGGYSSIACHIVGLKPVYADINEHSHLMDIESAISCVTEHTAIIVATHLYGGVLDVEELRKQLDNQGHSHIAILEDCAQAHGAMLRNRKVGAIGNMATFSFYPTKNLGAVGDAGCIVTNDDSLFEEAKCLSQYGWKTKYNIDMPFGRNSRMDEIQAAFLNLSLTSLDDWNKRRIEIFNHYKSFLKNNMRMVESKLGNVAHLAVLQCEKPDSLKEFLNQNGVQTDIHYPILDFEQIAWNNRPYRLAPMGIETSKSVSRQILTLPCYPTLSNDDVDYIGNLIRQWIKING